MSRGPTKLRPGVRRSDADSTQFTPTDFTDPSNTPDGVGKPVVEDEFLTFAEIEGTKSEHYAAGYGPEDDSTNTGGWSDLDLKLTPDDGTTVNDAEGRIRYAVFSDLRKNVLVGRSGTTTANELRAAVSAGLRDKILLAARHQKVAGDDSLLVLQYEAAPGEGGQNIYIDGSTYQLGVAAAEMEGSQ